MKYTTITWDTSNIRFEPLPEDVTNTGKVFRRLELTVELKCDGESDVFSILHNDTKQAEKYVQVEAHET